MFIVIKLCIYLFYLVIQGNQQIADLLLIKGTNVNIMATIGVFETSNDPSKCGKTVLELAVEKRNIGIVQSILRYSPDLSNLSNINALKTAVTIQFTEIVNDLVKYGFTLGPQEVNNPRLLHNAIKMGSLPIIEHLLKHGAAVNRVYRDSPGFTPLHTAVDNRQEEAALLLLRHGADVNARDDGNNIALFHAVENNDLNIVKLLLVNGSIVGVDILCTAVMKASQEIIAVILQCGANINASYADGKTPLHYLSKRCKFWNRETDGEEEVGRLLINKGAKVNDQTEEGITPLHSAARDGCQQVVELLLNNNAKVNCITHCSKITPLHFAATNKTNDVIRVLLDKGADVNASMKDGSTALHIAVRYGTVDIVQEFLQRGADLHVNIKEAVDILCLDYDYQVIYSNVGPRTPHHAATTADCSNFLDNNLMFGDSVYSTDDYCQTAMHLAAQKDSEGIVKILLRCGADINSKDESGSTPLHYAAKGGHIQLAKVFIEHDADVNVVNNNNKTPLDLARFGVTNILGEYEVTYAPKLFVIDIIKSHIIKMKVANMYVREENLQSFDEADVAFEKDCEEELKTLQNTMLTTHISFYDILKANMSQISSFVKNEKIIEVFKSGEYEEQFPLYADIIRNHFRKGEERNEILKNNPELFYFLRDHVYALPSECYDKIFSYLSNKDLKSLIGAFVTVK